MIIMARDTSGNTNAQFTAFTVEDTKAPVIREPIVKPQAGRQGTKFVISAKITDNDEVSSAKATINVPSANAVVVIMKKENGNTYEGTYQHLPFGKKGKYTATITAQDPSNNKKSAITSFTVV